MKTVFPFCLVQLACFVLSNSSLAVDSPQKPDGRFDREFTFITNNLARIPWSNMKDHSFISNLIWKSIAPESSNWNDVGESFARFSRIRMPPSPRWNNLDDEWKTADKFSQFMEVVTSVLKAFSPIAEDSRHTTQYLNCCLRHLNRLDVACREAEQRQRALSESGVDEEFSVWVENQRRYSSYLGCIRANRAAMRMEIETLLFDKKHLSIQLTSNQVEQLINSGIIEKKHQKRFQFVSIREDEKDAIEQSGESASRFPGN